MELRVSPLRVPALPEGGYGPLPGVDRPADTSAMAPLADFLAGAPLKMPAGPATVRDVIRRSAVQDLALAQAGFAQRALDLFRVNSAFRPRPFGAEWWLRLRDWVFAGPQP
jgi:hypothetical protein